MTPWGGVGTSMAVSTAITAADVIYSGFKNNDLSLEKLQEVQNRRKKEWK